MKQIALEEDSGNKIIIRMILGLSAVLALGFGTFVWWGGQENHKKAQDLYAKAQDACQHNYVDTCLLQVGQALRLEENADFYRLKFNALYNQDKAHEAKLALEKLLVYEPNNAHYHYLMKVMQFSIGNTKEAFQSIDKALALQPDNNDYWVAKATMLFELGRQSEAIPIYEKLISKEPKYYHFWDQYALSYSNSEKYQEALSIRLKGLHKNPNDYLQHYGLGSLYDQMGRLNDAVMEYRRSLELHPMENSIAAQRIFQITKKRVPASLENVTSDTLSITSEHNVMFVTADINGVKGRFLLDTGASMAAIYKNKVSKYNVTPLPAALSFETANGVIQAPLAYGSVRLGRHDLDYVRFAVIKDSKNPNVDGIIGMNILNEFQFSIDQKAGYLTLRGK